MIQSRKAAKSAGAILKEIREADGLSQVDVARRADPPFSFGYPSDLEIGKVRSPQIEQVPRIAKAYGITAWHVLEIFGVLDRNSIPENPAAQAIGSLVLELDDARRLEAMTYILKLAIEQAAES